MKTVVSKKKLFTPKYSEKKVDFSDNKTENGSCWDFWFLFINKNVSHTNERIQEREFVGVNVFMTLPGGVFKSIGFCMWKDNFNPFIEVLILDRERKILGMKSFSFTSRI